MHPDIMSEYGLYMTDAEIPPIFCVDLTGFTGMWATRILGEVYEDEYTGYVYEEGEENIVEIFVMADEFDLDVGDEIEYDLEIEDDDDGEF